MRYLAWLFGCSCLLQAHNVETLISHAMDTHPTIKAIEARVNAAQSAVDRADNLSDPSLNFRMNDIQLQDISNRSIEPMQTNSVSITQKLPWFGKREALKESELAQKEVVFASLKEAQAALAERIKKNSAQIWMINNLETIVDKTSSLARQNVELSEAYNALKNNQHASILASRLVLSRLKTEHSQLEADKQTALAQLSYLSGMEVDKVEVSMQEPKIPLFDELHENLEHNYRLEMLENVKRKQARLVTSAQLDKNIDPIVQAEYSQRQAFKDYVSVGIGFSLPIYGTQESIVEQRSAELLAAQSDTVNLREELEAELKGLYSKLENQQRIYHIIKDESLPQIEHMFDLVRLNVTSGGDMSKYVDLLEQKLALEKEMVRAQGSFYMTMAEIDRLTGKIK